MSGRRKLARFEFEWFLASHLWLCICKIRNTPLSNTFPCTDGAIHIYVYIYYIKLKDEIWYYFHILMHEHFCLHVFFNIYIKSNIYRHLGLHSELCGDSSCGRRVVGGTRIVWRCLQRFSRSDTQLELWRAVKLSLERWVTKTCQRRLFKIKV